MSKSITIEVSIPNEGKRIVSLISEGLTVKEISKELAINSRTLERKIESMRTTFDCYSAAHLVATFIRKGIIK